MNHDEASELLGAYALDAVEGDEEADLREHLAECPRCRSELSALVEAAAALGDQASDQAANAPVGVWDQISGQIAAQPPPLRLMTAVSAGQATVQPVAPWRRRAVAFAAAAAVVACAFLGWDVMHLDSRVAKMQAAIASNGVAQAAAAAALAPHSHRLELASSNGVTEAEVVILPSGQGYVLSSSLPHLGAGRTYQLWGLSGTHPISIGLLGSSGAPAAFRIDRKLSALMVTAEPAGGTVAPTTPVLAQASLHSL
jgi:hypothetical protein